MDKRYPIGKPQFDLSPSVDFLNKMVQSIADFPNQLKEQLAKMNADQLATPYREGGWTGHQVVHHLADSHINAYVRVKFVLTSENVPVAQGYDEALWAKTPDVAALPVGVSVAILEGLHARFAEAFKGLDEAGWKKSYFHSGYKTNWELQKVVQLYAWHGQHHLAHLKLIE